MIEGITNERLEALKELAIWQYDDKGSFCSMLYRLISKADGTNLKRVEHSFPEYIWAHQEWNKFPGINDVFDEYGIDISDRNNIKIIKGDEDNV